MSFSNLAPADSEKKIQLSGAEECQRLRRWLCNAALWQRVPVLWRHRKNTKASNPLNITTIKSVVIGLCGNNITLLCTHICKRRWSRVNERNSLFPHNSSVLAPFCSKGKFYGSCSSLVVGDKHTEIGCVEPKGVIIYKLITIKSRHTVYHSQDYILLADGAENEWKKSMVILTLVSG